MADQGKSIRRRIYRPAASATWEHNHQWGAQLGDNTNLRVTRTNGGSMNIAYGKESVEIRSELVTVLAEMVAAASEWVDEHSIPPGQEQSS